MDTVSTTRRWKHIAALVNDGAELEIHGGGSHFRMASLCDESRNVCMFECGGMDFEAIMDHLEELAKRYVEENVATDEVNGSEHSVW
jgi:hypothetical protein